MFKNKTPPLPVKSKLQHVLPMLRVTFGNTVKRMLVLSFPFLFLFFLSFYLFFLFQIFIWIKIVCLVFLFFFCLLALTPSLSFIQRIIFQSTEWIDSSGDWKSFSITGIVSDNIQVLILKISLSFLSFRYLHSNQLSGSIPVEIGNLSQLQYL